MGSKKVEICLKKKKPEHKDSVSFVSKVGTTITSSADDFFKIDA